MKTLIQIISFILILTLNLLQISHLQAQCHMGDWAALKAFYVSTNGDNWTNNTGWEQVTGTTPPVDCDLGTMYGVTLDGNGRVGSLSLWGDQLSGSLPPEIGDLTNLTYLYLATNNISGNIPPEIGNLSNLTYISLFNNELGGSIPSTIGNLTGLTYLNLGSNHQITGSIPAEIGNLSNLVTLLLYSNNLNGSIPPEIGNLTNLETLQILSNQLSGNIPPEIGNLINLEIFSLRNNQLIGAIPPELGNLSSLANLDLNDNQLSGNIPPEIGGLTNLTYMGLSENQLTGSIPPEIENLTNLSFIELASNQLSGNIPIELCDLSSLTGIYMPHNQFTGGIPPEIGNLTNLEYLTLNDNQITDIPAELANLSNLKRLWVYNNQLSGCYNSNLINLCTQLDPIFNTNAYISDGNNFNTPWEDFCNAGEGTCNFSPCRQSDSLALVTLYNSTNGPSWTNTWNLNQPIDTWYGVILNENGCVTCLDLDGNPDCDQTWNSWGNNLSGSIPAEIGNLTNLTYLNLAKNQLNGNIPVEIGNLTNLIELRLSSNNLSGSIPVQLSNLANLTYLSLNSNQLSGNIPAAIGGMNNLTYLFLSGNQLTGNIPLEIGNLTNLINLSLSDNQLIGSIPIEIGNLTNLINLTLNENLLTGNIPPEIGNLTNATLLYLHTNQLSGNIPPEIGNLNSLEFLHLASNQLTGDIPVEISYLTNLTNLILYNNQLTGSIPSEIGNLSELIYLRIHSNQLIGCYDSNLLNLCNQIDAQYNTNGYISNGNNFDAPWEDFCATGAGTCSAATSDVFPGDCNTDGIVNLDDVLFWAIAEGFSGTPRPNATTDCALEACSDWSQSVNGINSKHQDCDGNGIVDTEDDQVIVSNFGCINDYTPPSYASGTPVYRVQPQGINADGKYQYDLYVENGSGAAAIAHGLSFTVSSDVIPISAIAMSTTGSSLHPDVEYAILDGNQCHAALTRTDNFDITCGGPIATFLIETSDIPVDVPFEIDIAYGSRIKADATLDNITGATAFGMYRGTGASTTSLLLDASVTHEQCNGLGSAIAIPSGGIPPYSYAWSTGANTIQVNNLASGTYTVTVTDDNGIDESLTLQINGQTPIYDANGNLLCGNLCPEYLAPSGVTGNGLYSASNALNADATIPAGNTAQYKAGQIIKLDQGFEVQPNAEFSAEIEDCQ